MRPMGNNHHLAFFNHPRMGEKVPQKELLEKSAETTDLAIITIGRNAGEYVDRKIENDFQLTNEEHALIQNVCQNYHKKGKKVVVKINPENPDEIEDSYGLFVCRMLTVFCFAVDAFLWIAIRQIKQEKEKENWS